MELHAHSLHPNLDSKDSQESMQISLMDEDSEGFDVGNLDLIGLEDACRKK